MNFWCTQRTPQPRKRNAEWSMKSNARIAKRITLAFGVRLKEHGNIRRASTTAVGDHLRDMGLTLLTSLPP